MLVWAAREFLALHFLITCSFPGYLATTRLGAASQWAAAAETAAGEATVPAAVWSPSRFACLALQCVCLSCCPSELWSEKSQSSLFLFCLKLCEAAASFTFSWFASFGLQWSFDPVISGEKLLGWWKRVLAKNLWLVVRLLTLNIGKLSDQHPSAASI